VGAHALGALFTAVFVTAGSWWVVKGFEQRQTRSRLKAKQEQDHLMKEREFGFQ
jgi:hypothetical protein